MKKTTKKVKEEVVATLGQATPKARISELTGDFGREDLNLLRDKLNEVIKSL